jgi:hypothetical protein
MIYNITHNDIDLSDIKYLFYFNNENKIFQIDFNSIHIEFPLKDIQTIACVISYDVDGENISITIVYSDDIFNNHVINFPIEDEISIMYATNLYSKIRKIVEQYISIEKIKQDYEKHRIILDKNNEEAIKTITDNNKKFVKNIETIINENKILKEKIQIQQDNSNRSFIDYFKFW